MIQIRVDLKDITDLQKIPRTLLNRALFDDIGRYMVSSTIRKIKSGIEPPNAPLTRAWKRSGLQLRDTGRLMSSISYKADDTSATIGTNLIYARIQQLGGTIVPKSAKKLYLPAGWETRKLMRQYGLTPGAVISGLRAAGYSIWQSKSGKALMAASRKDKKPFVLFILKDRVEIPSRKFLYVDEIDKKAIHQKVIQRLKLK